MHKRNIGYGIVGTLLLVCVGIWLVVYAETPRGVLTFAVLDIGQGDSIYIESPVGERVLVDGGLDATLLRELPKVMPLFARSFDAIIETHPDSDHIGGFVDLLKRYSVGVFISPGIIKTTNVARALEQEVTDQKIHRYIARRGMSLNLGGGAMLDVLYPDRDVSHIKNDNDGCVVTRLVYGKVSMLLTCDASKKVEARLMVMDGANLASDILKVGHHGSKTSTGAKFVATVRPSIAIISVGERNRYGHPTQEVLDVLASAHILTLRTDKIGTIIYQSDGETLWRVR